ncbi:MAG: hypothetical protein V4773_12420 [Verrucomicrobiota bacterium]
MSASIEAEYEQTMVAYRKSRFTMVCHVIYLGLCVAVCLMARRMMGLPPQVLGLVVIVGLVLFGKDIMTFMHLRSKLARLRSEYESAS